MKKIFLSIILIGITTVVNAQWNPNGNNSTIGKITADNILVNNLHLAYGNMSSNWSQYPHLKDKNFIYTNSRSKGMFFSSYGQGADIRFQTGNGWNNRPYASLILSNNGNVGIGTTIPSGKLEILKNTDLSSAITLPNSGLIIRADNDGNDASLRFGVDNVNLKAVIQTQQTTTGAKFDLLINPFGGNVAIGTKKSDSWKLAVNGKIRAKEIKVETGWSDFVFYDDYKLSTLQEVENHIIENGHLKDIPSAKEVEENGIFLGEMDSKLLQKIEELTLYTIQQQKEIETLKIINSKLLEVQKRLDKLEKK